MRLKLYRSKRWTKQKKIVRAIVSRAAQAYTHTIKHSGKNNSAFIHTTKQKKDIVASRSKNVNTKKYILHTTREKNHYPHITHTFLQYTHTHTPTKKLHEYSFFQHQ